MKRTWATSGLGRSRRARAWAALLLALAVPAGASAAAPSCLLPLDWGPIAVRSRAPLFDARLSYVPGRVVVLPRGQLELSTNLSHVNIWAQMPGYFFDGEWTRLDLRIALGAGHGREWLADVGLVARFGGLMDSFIMGFHSAFGVTQARRDRYPRNALRVATLAGPTAQVQLKAADRGFGLANPVIGVRQRLTRPGSWPYLSAELRIKLPVGSIARHFATPGPAALVALNLLQPLGRRVSLTAATGLMMAPGKQRSLAMPLATVQKFLLVALAVRLSQSTSLVAHYLNQDGIVESAMYAPMNQTTHEFVLGAKWAPTTSDSWVLEAGLIENSIHDANTPDFGVSLGSRWRL